MNTIPSPRTQLARGYAIALVSAVVLSTTAVFIRYLTRTFGLPPLILAFWRDVFTCLALLAVLAVLRPALLCVERSHLPYLAGFGLALAVFNAFLTLSVAQNGAAISTVLVYSSAAFAALLDRFVLREALGWVKLAVIALCLAGCALVAGALDPAEWRSNPIGIVTGLASGLGYAGYSLMGRGATKRGLNPWTALLYTFGFAGLFLLAASFLPGIPGGAARLSDFFWLGRQWTGWLILVTLAAGPTLLGFGLYVCSMVYLPSSTANLVVMIEVVFTALIAYALLGEQLTGIQLAGSGLIATGVIGLRVYEGWRVKPATAAQSVPVPAD
jgi:drug/metabolite transporter (DMT)-like permease